MVLPLTLIVGIVYDWFGESEAPVVWSETE